MQFDNQKTRNVADTVAKILAGETVSEELKGQQHKIDKNKNNKIDAHDFKILRGEKPEVNKEEVEITEEDAYDKDRYAVRNGKAVKDNPSHVGSPNYKDQPHHVWASSAEDALKKSMNKEEVEPLDEIKMAELPSRKIQGRGAYGSSKQQPHPIDTLKGPKEKELKDIESEKKKKKPFSEMVDSYKTEGLKSLKEMFIKEEPTSDEYKKELEDAQAKSEGKKKNPDIAKGKVDAVKQEEVEQFEEGAMPASVIQHKEKIRLASNDENKKRFAGKSKSELEQMARRHGYGDKNPYAKFHDGITEEVEQIDELNKDTLKSYVSKATDSARTMPGYGTNAEKSKKTIRHAGISKATEKLAKEEVEQIEEREMTDAEMKKREDIVKSMKKGMAGFKERYGDRAKNVMYATATKQAMK